MLGKMIIHGVVAAVLIASAAAVYAQSRDANFLSSATAMATTGEHDGHQHHDDDEDDD